MKALAALIALCCSVAIPVHATIISVPEDFLVIQDAIDAAAEGDTVLVGPDTYSGPGNRALDFHGINIKLMSELGPSATIIDCGGLDRALVFHSGEDSTSVVSGFTISNGYEGFGGGLWCSDGSAPRISDCIFVNNTATSNGGGLICHNARAVVTNCVFLNNHARWGGGAFFETDEAARLSDVVFRGNDAEITGGGLYLWDGCEAVLVLDCTFLANSASSGAGAYCDGSFSTLKRCTFAGNTATNHGGGLGCTMATGVSQASIISSTFSANSAVRGGGIDCYWSSPLIQGCVVAFSAEGEGLSCWVSTPTVDHCCVFGNAGGDTLCGNVLDNIFVDPLFCGFASEDWRVCSNSPCLPQNNPWLELIGAHGEGCGACASTGVAELIERTHWGAVKAKFR